MSEIVKGVKLTQRILYLRYCRSVCLRTNVRDTVLGSEYSRYCFSMYSGLWHVSGRLSIFQGGRKIQDYGFRPRQHRSWRPLGLSNRFRALRSRGQDGTFSISVLLHRCDNL